MSSISDTAFLVNWSKARDPELSQDPWAHLWVTEQSARYAEDFTANVFPGHPLAPALRNRYFVDAIRTFEYDTESCVLLNIGAGFTSYAYHLSDTNPVYEFEMPSVIAYKLERLQEFIAADKIPQRTIHHVGLDLNDPTAIDTMRDIIVQHPQPHFVLLEGIVYYLKPSTIDALFTMLSTTLPRGSRIGLVTWPPEIERSRTMQALQHYFETTLGFPRQEYTWLGREYFQHWKNLQMLDAVDFPQLEQLYCPAPHQLTTDNFVDSQMLVLGVR